MNSKGKRDYIFIIEKIKGIVPNWSPSNFLGDLEIGQSKAVLESFVGITSNFCYFHLTQAWFRYIKICGLEDMTHHGSSLYEFWSLLRCLPFGKVADVEKDFNELVKLIPTPITPGTQKFIDYIRKFYVGPRPTLMFPPATWNVTDRSINALPRTTNLVESTHRNLKKCVEDKRGRAPKCISDLLSCLRREADKLKYDHEAITIDPSYKVNADRKKKDLMKDKRILTVLQGGLTGTDFLKAIRSAKKYT